MAIQSDLNGGVKCKQNVNVVRVVEMIFVVSKMANLTLINVN